MWRTGRGQAAGPRRWWLKSGKSCKCRVLPAEGGTRTREEAGPEAQQQQVVWVRLSPDVERNQTQHGHNQQRNLQEGARLG